MPDKISENLVDPDQLIIRFKLPKIFIDEVDFQRLDETLEVSIPLPQQVSLAEFEAIKASGQSAATSAQAFSLLSFLVCLVLGYGLKYLWNIINVL